MSDSKPTYLMTFSGDKECDLMYVAAATETWKWIAGMLPPQDGVTQAIFRIIKEHAARKEAASE